MSVVNQWRLKLKNVNKDIDDYTKILENEELNSDMRSFCHDKIVSKTKYKRLIEETIDIIESCIKH